MLLFAFGLMTGGTLRAQEPFSTLDIHLSLQYDVRPTLVHQFWTPGAGVSLFAATPVQQGYLEFGCAVHRFRNKVEVPGFGGVWLYAGWGIRRELLGRARLGSSVRLGNYRMSFDSSEHEFPGTVSESELMTGLALHASVQFSSSTSVFGSLTGARIYTSPRIPIWFASMGIRRTLALPSVLQEVLR